MLSAMPLFNNNNTVAMAQGYDNYYGESYSQYPTDDKKYECRTGPFEGFFVSSVEFCKHVKFDDKKDHRDTKVGPPGPQGPPGPAGPQGIQGMQGIQGPPGITQLINGTNVYLVTRPATATDIALEVTAPCEAGDFVINGGYSISGSFDDDNIVTQDGPIIFPPGGGWLTHITSLPVQPVVHQHSLLMRFVLTIHHNNNPLHFFYF